MHAQIVPAWGAAPLRAAGIESTLRHLFEFGGSLTGQGAKPRSSASHRKNRVWYTLMYHAPRAMPLPCKSI